MWPFGSQNGGYFPLRIIKEDVLLQNPTSAEGQIDGALEILNRFPKQFVRPFQRIYEILPGHASRFGLLGNEPHHSFPFFEIVVPQSGVIQMKTSDKLFTSAVRRYAIKSLVRIFTDVLKQPRQKASVTSTIVVI
ncbi:MAG: hypothetical protein ABI824_08655 [Acidobacteriota bacterium]